MESGVERRSTGAFRLEVMGRLKTLKSGLQVLGPRLQTLPRIGATERLRGSSAVKRRKAWLTANPLCVDCRAEGLVRAGDEVDHETPLWQGGRDDETNFATRCFDHHKAKTSREAAERARGG